MLSGTKYYQLKHKETHPLLSMLSRVAIGSMRLTTWLVNARYRLSRTLRRLTILRSWSDLIRRYSWTSKDCNPNTNGNSQTCNNSTSPMQLRTWTCIYPNSNLINRPSNCSSCKRTDCHGSLNNKCCKWIGSSKTCSLTNRLMKGTIKLTLWRQRLSSVSKRLEPCCWFKMLWKGWRRRHNFLWTQDCWSKL